MTPSIDRRTFVRGGAAFAIAALTPVPASAKDQLVVATFPGTWNEVHREILAPYFQKKTNADVRRTIMLATDPVAKLAATRGQPPFDVAILDEGPTLDAVKQGVLEKYPAAKSPHFNELGPPFRNEWGPAISMQAIGLAYNPKKVKTAPRSWDDLWNPAYKGRVGPTSPSSTSRATSRPRSRPRWQRRRTSSFRPIARSSSAAPSSTRWRGRPTSSRSSSSTTGRRSTRCAPPPSSASTGRSSSSRAGAERRRVAAGAARRRVLRPVLRRAARRAVRDEPVRRADHADAGLAPVHTFPRRSPAPRDSRGHARARRQGDARVPAARLPAGLGDRPGSPAGAVAPRIRGDPAAPDQRRRPYVRLDRHPGPPGHPQQDAARRRADRRAGSAPLHRAGRRDGARPGPASAHDPALADHVPADRSEPRRRVGGAGCRAVANVRPGDRATQPARRRRGVRPRLCGVRDGLRDPDPHRRCSAGLGATLHVPAGDGRERLAVRGRDLDRLHVRRAVRRGADQRGRTRPASARSWLSGGASISMRCRFASSSGRCPPLPSSSSSRRR